MKNTRLEIGLLVTVLLVICGQVFGLTQFNDGQVHTLDYAINDEIWVDFQSPNLRTTINCFSGASNSYYLKAYENSIINLYGGTIASYAYIYNNTELNILGGRISSFLLAYDNSKVAFSGGSLQGFATYGDNVQLEMSGNASLSYCHVEGGNVTIKGGRISWYIGGYGDSVINISGGDIEEIRGTTNSIIYIKGYDFKVDGKSIGFSEIKTMGYNPDPYRRLQGILLNGDIMDLSFILSSNSKIVLQEAPVRYNLIIQTDPAGIETTNPSVGVHSYGGTVVLSAYKYVNCPSVYRFDHWVGNVVEPNEPNTSILMDSDKIVTAVFIDDRQCGDECHDNNVFGDYNHDCLIDLTDFVQFASNWMNCTKPSCD